MDKPHWECSKELAAYVIATQSDSEVVTDESMGFPEDWHLKTHSTSVQGHQEGGRSILIHSLAVSKPYQGIGLGSIILKAYLQRMESSGIADRTALIAHDHVIKFYEKLGFENKGESKCKFGSGGWYDMVGLLFLQQYWGVTHTNHPS